MRILMILGLFLSLNSQLAFSEEGPDLIQTQKYIRSMADKYGACESVHDGDILETKGTDVQFRPAKSIASIEVNGGSTYTIVGEIHNSYWIDREEFDPQQISSINVRSEVRVSECMKASVMLYCDDEKDGVFFANKCVKITQTLGTEGDPERRVHSYFTNGASIELTDRRIADKIADAIIHYWNLNGWEMEDDRVSEDLF